MANLDRNPARRRGTVVVFTAVSFTVLIGFAAPAIDVGYTYSVQAQLQRNADAAPLAGAIILTSDKILTPSYDPTADVISEVHAYAALNISGTSPLLPCSITIDTLNDQINDGHGPDGRNSNKTTRLPGQSPDGEHEIWISPAGMDAAGNLGTLDIGILDT